MCRKQKNCAIPLAWRAIATRSSARLRFCIFTILLSLGPLSFARVSDEEKLLESGKATRIHAPSTVPGELKVISYNIRWRSGDNLRKLADALRSDKNLTGAAILGLQEVDRNKKRSGNTNTIKFLAEQLGMYYAWAAPPSPSQSKMPEEEETGVAILSEYPLSDVHRIVLPHEGPAGRRRVALGATVTIGKSQIRFYSVHSETRVAIEKKIDQMRAVIADLDPYSPTMPAIIVGDFNTWEQDAVEKTRKLFNQKSFFTPFDDAPTFSRRALFLSIELKLDWIWLRNLEVESFGIENQVRFSDHWPIWAKIKSTVAKISRVLIRVSRSASRGSRKIRIAKV